MRLVAAVLFLGGLAAHLFGDDGPVVSPGEPLILAVDGAFHRANPDFKSQMARELETEKLDLAVSRLCETCHVEEEKRPKIRARLQQHINDWLDSVVEMNGCLPPEKMQPLLARLDDWFRDDLGTDEYPRYLRWRLGAHGDNPLRVVMDGNGLEQVFPPPSDVVRMDPKPLPLRVRKHPMRLLAQDVHFAGKQVTCLPSPDEWNPQVQYGDVSFLQRCYHGDPLIVRNNRTGAFAEFDFWSLAAAAGWYAAGEGNPRGVSGLKRGGRWLWMGTAGLGILALDPQTYNWRRYDVKDTPIPGDHAWVTYADSDFVFTGRGYRESLSPSVAASLLIFSLRHEEWLAIEAVPTRDAIGLGTSAIPDLEPEPQAVVSFSGYEDADYVPLSPGRSCLACPSRVHLDGGKYCLQYGSYRRVFAELGLRRDLLEQAFDASAPGK
ncbi:MAG: hypothetical protein HYZ53_29735 [Planctomycetes bacterium]|nr:hypothetical protein [Planctomycetota bacterium]